MTTIIKEFEQNIIFLNKLNIKKICQKRNILQHCKGKLCFFMI